MAMGSTTQKLTLIAKRFLFIVICGLCVSCNGQAKPSEENRPPVQHTKSRSKNTVMKKFDIDAYEKKIKDNPEYEGYMTPDGTEITEYYRLPPEAPDLDAFDREKVLAYTRIEKFPDGYRVAYQFNNKGNLTAVSYYYSTSLETGTWQQFNDTGAVISETDKDKGYAFTLPDVIEFGKRHQVDFARTGRIKRGYDPAYKTNVWELRWTVDVQAADPYQQVFVLEGATGKVLSEKKEGPPRRV